MSEQAQLPKEMHPWLVQPGDVPLEVMVKARDLYAWYLALQEVGFNEAMAYGLLAPLMVCREIRLEAD